MSAYCTAADLREHFANIDRYDLKKTLPNNFMQHSGAVYKLSDSGPVSVLYQDGADLGDPAVSVAAIAAEGDWFYDSAADTVYVQIGATDSVLDFRFDAAPLTWAAAVTSKITQASAWLESALDWRFPRPLPFAKGSSTDYDFLVVRITALMACHLLISSTSASPMAREDLAAIDALLRNDTQTGLLQMLNRGQYKLSFEITSSDASQIERLVRDDASTGDLTDQRGEPGAKYEKYLVRIVTGGTLTLGTENETVTFEVLDSQGQTVQSEELIDGYYQTIGGGISARFIPGIYTAGDTWTNEVQGVTSTTGTVTRGKLRRR